MLKINHQYVCRKKKKQTKSDILHSYFEEYAANMTASSPSKKKRKTLNSRAAEQLWIPDVQVLGTRLWQQTEEAWLQKALQQSLQDQQEKVVSTDVITPAASDADDEKQMQQPEKKKLNKSSRLTPRQQQPVSPSTDTKEELLTDDAESQTQDIKLSGASQSSRKAPQKRPMPPNTPSTSKKLSKKKCLSRETDKSVPSPAATTEPIISIKKKKRRRISRPPAWSTLWKRVQLLAMRLDDFTWLDDRLYGTHSSPSPSFIDSLATPRSTISLSPPEEHPPAGCNSNETFQTTADVSPSISFWMESMWSEHFTSLLQDPSLSSDAQWARFRDVRSALIEALQCFRQKYVLSAPPAAESKQMEVGNENVRDDSNMIEVEGQAMAVGIREDLECDGNMDGITL
jgi:hypothetical protein